MRPLSLLSAALVATLVLAAAAAAGGQLRALREGGDVRGQAASRPTPTPWPTIQADASPSPVEPRPTKAHQAVTPSPRPPDVRFAVSGRIAFGSRPAAGVDVRIYPANEWNRGPTPVPPSAAETRTAADGTFRVLLAPGSYRVGAWQDEDEPAVLRSGYWFSSWYGGGPVVGAGRDLVVTDRDLRGVDISWLRTVRISGRVLDAGGKGVGAAAVTADTKAPGVAYVAMRTATADATGAYVIHMAEGAIHLTASGGDPSAPSWTERDIVARADVRVDLVLPASSQTRQP